MLMPLKLTPECKEIIWGGNRLKNEYNKVSSLSNIALAIIYKFSLLNKTSFVVLNTKSSSFSFGIALLSHVASFFFLFIHL